MAHRKEGELKKNDDFRSSSGNWIQLCVVEELDKEAPESAPAVITFGGFSLCRDHFEMVTNMIKAGIPMGQVVQQMMADDLPEVQ